ncbi:hypothetical protein DNH61_18880 [Paenibacillus sambharensis]|uniref:Copper amine oxidase-like N-terminal domain-containing protein n=1 Tax=Paenibacillus sambharensis TaxID=1803190 RepID=A0A2W1LSP0_9BACL|nr:beta-propeller domain-containing protein [Paenibacillus sambharensis]PZD94457.1 hypothetical protein DNH61_18880 [Paenibacillus sambharensis]
MSIGKRFSKPVLAALLAVLLILAAASAPRTQSHISAAETGIRIVVNGQELALSTPAVKHQGTTMVPLRQIAEAMQAEVKWTGHGDDRTPASVQLARQGRTAVLTIGGTTLKTDGVTVKLDQPPYVKAGVTMVPLRAITESLGAVVAWEAKSRTVQISEPAELPVVGTMEKMNELLEASEQRSVQAFDRGPVKEESAGAADGGSSKNAADTAAPAAGVTDSHSSTNVQVEGVDEADWAKTDGRFIYQLSGSRVFITDIRDAADPKLAATLTYKEEDHFYPQQLYADGKHLIVIGQYQQPIAIEPGPGDGSTDKAVTADNEVLRTRSSELWMPMRSSIRTLIYEISGSGQPALKRQTQMEGNYLTSRKIGSSLYVLTNKFNYPYRALEGEENNSAAYEPVYSDSLSGGTGDQRLLPLDKIRYFPESPESSMLLVGSVNLSKPEEELQVSAYMGSGQTVYASARHLYVAIAKYEDGHNTVKQTTVIHKFRLDQGKTVYIGEGSVPGGVLNQFSMDEHNGYFRIATTSGDMWASGEAASRNNLYVLDEQLARAGTLEGLAPGERIYSVRFMGERAYMVTFRNVDPLFAIDLRNPFEPSVLGQLKIPGYSDYLHPYDEHHLIGFGKETITLPAKGSGPDEVTAFYQGMKIALFDVTDVSQPKEKFKTVIGDRGTHSELLNDHRALLFSRSKGLLAFPVTVMEIKEDSPEIETGGIPAYGEFTYQGAYVYRIDTEKGFELRERITHLTEKDYARSGHYGLNDQKSVRRILYAGDTLYTLSEQVLKANSLKTMEEQGTLHYPAEKEGSGSPGMKIE